jgi:hypothetical protein
MCNALGIDRLRKIFGRTRHPIDVEALILAMVLNSLRDPESKLCILRWFEAVALPGAMAESIVHQHLLRAMHALVEHSDEVEQAPAGLLRPLGRSRSGRGVLRHDHDSYLSLIELVRRRLYRVMHTRLHVSETGLSPDRVLAQLHRIQHNHVTLNGMQLVAGLSSISRDQAAIRSVLTVSKSTS